MPPSPEVLRQRLINRGTESADEIERRMARVIEELDMAPRFDTIINNEVLDVAIDQTVLAIQSFLNSH